MINIPIVDEINKKIAGKEGERIFDLLQKAEIKDEQIKMMLNERFVIINSC